MVWALHQLIIIISAQLQAYKGAGKECVQWLELCAVVYGVFTKQVSLYNSEGQRYKWFTNCFHKSAFICMHGNDITNY